MTPLRKAKQAVQAYQAALPELQAAPIIESDAELFAELSEFSQGMFDAELLEDFESLRLRSNASLYYIRLPERAKPYKPFYKVYNDYSPPPVMSGYTIGPGIEAGGGDSGGGWEVGGGYWDGSGGGSDWGDGGGDARRSRAIILV